MNTLIVPIKNPLFPDVSLGKWMITPENARRIKYILCVYKRIIIHIICVKDSLVVYDDRNSPKSLFEKDWTHAPRELLNILKQADHQLGEEILNWPHFQTRRFGQLDIRQLPQPRD